MQKWFNRFILTINGILAFALLISYLSKYISPSLSFLIALLGMAYSYILVSFIISSIILFLSKNRKWFLVNIIIILLGWGSLNSWIQFNSPSKETPDIKLLSYNIKLFNLYNWKHNQEHKNAILNFMKKENPDIISLQEFFYNNSDFSLDSISAALKMPYYYIADSRFLYGSSHFGQAIFSKFPIKKSEVIRFPNTNNLSFFCDIEIKENKIIRIFNNHLESYRFHEDDYRLIQNLRKKQTDISKILGLKERLELALIKRSYQAEKVSSLVNSSPYPVIVTGDFNDTPNSYTYHQISRYLYDAFIEKGNGFSNTYKGSFPSFRIDYILYSKGLKATSYQRIKFDGSDHFPIFANFILEKE